MIDREEIKKFIPHREPMLLVDWTEQDGDCVRAGYHVRGDEFFVQGHFPGYPVVPGVILCEIMAQSSTLILGDELVGNTPFYAGLDHVRFKRQVRPGDDIVVTCRFKERRGGLIIVSAQAKVDGQLCVRAEMEFMLVPNDSLNK